MINHNENDLHCSGIEPGLPDSQSNTLPIELTGQFAATLFYRASVYCHFHFIAHGFLPDS
jgi:hypothetical protein